jgi:hypothetical protein
MQNKQESLMYKKIGVILLAGLFVIPAVALAAKGGQGALHQEHKAARETHRQEQQTENKAFRATLKGKTGEEKSAAIKANRETQHTENQAFNAGLHQENMDALNSKLANNTKMTDAQKTELVNQFESQYQENVSFRDGQYSENVAFFDQVANDANMTQQQKKAAIKAHFDEQKAQDKEQVQAQHEENKAFRKELRSEGQAGE